MCFQTSACRGIAPSEEVKGHEGRDNGLCGGGGGAGAGSGVCSTSCCVSIVVLSY